MFENLTRNLPGLAASCALAVAFAPAAMNAQSTPPPAGNDDEVVEEIIVKGFRRSIQNAIDLKRGSEQILEAISAEDIGKLPDVSIAESLARASGLAGQRLNGRSQVISVRGLSPDFTTTLLNGRQQVSVGDNRGVEYDQYPSGLINNVLIYKTPSANLLNQGLAGTVDLRTIRPLKLSERVVNLTARYVQNGISALNPDGEDSGLRANFFYADQFADGTLGVALGLSTLTQPSQGEHHRAWGYTGADFDEDGTNEQVIGGLDSLVRTSELERNALMAVVEWQPSDAFGAAFDLYYSTFEEENLLRGVEFGFAWGGSDACTNTKVADTAGDNAECTVTATIENGFVTAGQYRDVETLVRNDVESRDTDLLALGLNLTYEVGGWSTELDWSYSEADREDQIVESYSGTGNGNVNFGGTRGGGTVGVVDFVSSSTGTRVPFTSGLDHATDDFFLADAHGWGGAGNIQAGYLNEPDITDDLTQLALRAERELDFSAFSRVEVGANFSTREKEKIVNEWIVTLGHEADGTDITTAALPDGASLTALEFLGIPGIQSYDPRGIIASAVLEDANKQCLGLDTSASSYCLETNDHPDVTEKSWTVEEDVVQLYAQLGIETELAGRRLSGNLGAQVVLSDQSSVALGAQQDGEGNTGGATSGATGTVTGGKSYTDFLPSLSLNWHLAENHVLRLGLARTLARARMDELRVSQQFGYNLDNIGSQETSGPLSFWSGSGGNPLLDPWIANGVDLSYEFYFPEDVGYFALAFYYKDLESWVFNGDTARDYSSLKASLRTEFEMIDLDMLFMDFADAQQAIIADPASEADEVTDAMERLQELQDIRDELTAANGGTFPEAVDILDQTTDIGAYSAPQNGEGGSVSGFEASLTINGDFFHPALEPFGLILNYTRNDSSVVATPGTPEITLPGLSEDVANFTLFYEKAGFAARVGGRYRSEFIGEVQGFGANREFKTVDDEFILDAQVSYAFPEESRYAGLSFYIQGTNLNDEPFVTYQNDDRRQVELHQEYGETWYFGVGYKF